MPYEEIVRPLELKEPIGCHLQAIGSVGGCFEWGNGAAEFDKYLKRNHGLGNGYRGAYFTGTIVSISDSPYYDRTREELKKRGFIHLATQPGAHGAYKMQLWSLGLEPVAQPKEENN